MEHVNCNPQHGKAGVTIKPCILYVGNQLIKVILTSARCVAKLLSSQEYKKDPEDGSPSSNTFATKFTVLPATTGALLVNFMEYSAKP